MNLIRWFNPSGEASEVHGDEGGHEMKMIKLQLVKEEREKQKLRRSRQRCKIGFYFALKTP